MSKFRLALVRQKYRPDGGAERFVSRALEALDSSHLQLNVITREWQGPVKPDWQIHICNPRKWGRISRERGFANAARALWQRESFDLVQSHERIPGCDLYRAGDGVHRRWLQQRSRILPAWKSRLLFADRYHRYVMQAEREMYEDPHLRGVICNAEMIKREIIEDFGLPADKIHVIYNAIDNQRFLPPGEETFAALRAKWQLPLQATCLIYVGSGFERKGLAAAIRAIAPTDRYLLVVGKDKDQPRYQALAKSLNCEARVRFFGMQSETLPFYQMADGLRSAGDHHHRLRRGGVYRQRPQRLCLRRPGYPGAAAGGDGPPRPRAGLRGRRPRPRAHHGLHQRAPLHPAAFPLSGSGEITMRILFVIDGLPGGGAEKVVLTLAAQFLHDGDRVSLISLRDVCEYPLPEGLDYQVVADRCRKPWRKLTELSRRARQLDAAVIRAEQQGQFDLVLSNLHKTDRIVARSRALRERNVWFCLHGVFSASYLGHRTGFDRWMKQQKIKRIYQGRNVVAVSDAVGRDLVEAFALRPAQLKTIYNPFDIAALRAEAEADSERPDGDYLIHVGRFHPGKRHDRLLEAYAQSGIDAPLVLLGQGKPEQEQRLRQLAKTLEIEDRVWFKGFQKNPLPWIKGARMLVLSSDSEGFGNVVVEALLLHTPVASTRCPGGVTEILTGELARGLADLTSPALAQTMQSIYHNPPAIDDAALEKFSVVSICQQYRQLQRT